MTYIDGFLLAAPSANREAYRKHAEEAWPMFRDLGALAMVEAWGDDVPDGKVNSINSAVMRKDDETAVFSWIIWADKAARMAGWQKMMEAGPPEGAMSQMPFDGSRMIYGGFERLLGDVRVKAGYIDGTVMAVPASRREAFTEASKKMAELFIEHGALTVVDAWGDDVPEGKVNDFHGAVLRKPDEAVVFSWIGWKDKASRDAAWEKIMGDARMEQYSPGSVGADMGRMIFGGFIPILDI